MISSRRHGQLARRPVELGPQTQIGGRPLTAKRQQRLELGLGQAGQVGPVPAQ
jgi:hypothetical protein